MYINMKIRKKAFKELIIFENAELTIKKGSFVAIKGPSGSGKTTLIKMIGCLEPFDGTYYIEDEEIVFNKSETNRKKYLTYIFQDPSLIPYLTIKENVLMPLKNLKLDFDINDLNEKSKLLGIDEIMDKRVSLISGGEQQRVAILRALMTNRPIILADEPTGDLDYLNVKIVMDLLKQINKLYNKTIIMVTHDDHLDHYFDNIFYLKDKIIKESENV